MWEAMQGKVDEHSGPEGQKGKLEGGGANEPAATEQPGETGDTATGNEPTV